MRDRTCLSFSQSVPYLGLLDWFTWHESSFKELNLHAYWSSTITVYIDLHYSSHCSVFYCVVMYKRVPQINQWLLLGPMTHKY